jgi:hypothetical protein
VTNLCRTLLLAMLCLFTAGAQSSLAASHSPGYKKVAGSLVLVGFPVRNSGSKLQIAFGTGFVITSDDRKSIVVTANHVIAPFANTVEPDLFVILPKAPNVKAHVTVLRHDQELDIAVLSIDAGNLPPVRISKDVPDKGTPVAIAGFPFAEVCGMAGMCGDDFLVPHAHKGELHDDLSSGEVSDAQSGQYSIMINLTADHGNSGSPLFDSDNGDVYGILTDALRGASDNLMPPQVYQNRAIAMNVGLAFISSAPGVSVALDGVVTRGIGKQPADSYSGANLGSSACVAAWKAFDAAYGEWLGGHGLLQSLAEDVSRPEYSGRIGELQAAGSRVPELQSTALSRMQTSLATMKSEGAAKISAAAATLLAAVGTATATDAALAASLPSQAGVTAARASEAHLTPAAKAMNDIIACN